MKDGGVVHLVVRPENIPVTSAPSAPAPSQVTTSTGVGTVDNNQSVPPGLLRAPVMQIQNLGNGVTVGRFTVDSGDVGETATDVGNLVTQIFSSVLPQVVQGLSDEQSEHASVGTESPLASNVEVQQPQQQPQPHQQQQEQQSSTSQNSSQHLAHQLFLAESHLQALRQSQSLQVPTQTYPQSSLAPLLDSLAISLHSAALPVMQLSQGLQQTGNPHQSANNVNIQAQVYRVQDMLRHLSEATGHLASALQQTQVPTPQPQLQNPLASLFPFPHMSVPGIPAHVQFHQNISQQPQQQRPEPSVNAPPVYNTSSGVNTPHTTTTSSTDMSRGNGVSPNVRVFSATSTGSGNAAGRNRGSVRITTNIPLTATRLSSQQSEAQTQHSNNEVEPQIQHQSAAMTSPPANIQSPPSSTSIPSTSSQPSPPSSSPASVRVESSGPQNFTTSSFSTSTSSASPSSPASNNLINPILQNLMGSVVNGVFPISTHIGSGHVASQIPHFIQTAMQLVPPVPPTSAGVHVASNTSVGDTSGLRRADNDTRSDSNHTGDEQAQNRVAEGNQGNSNDVANTGDVVDDCLADFEFD